MPYLAHTGLEKWVSKRFEFRLNKHLFNSRDYAELNFVRSAGMYSLLIQSFDRRVKRKILKALVEGKPRGLEGRRGNAALRHLQGDRTTRLSPWYNRERSPMRYLFEAEGWAVALYTSAEEFLAKPRSAENACLLVDQRLPGMDGVALITNLRDQKLDTVLLLSAGRRGPEKHSLPDLPQSSYPSSRRPPCASTGLTQSDLRAIFLSGVRRTTRADRGIT